MKTRTWKRLGIFLGIPVLVIILAAAVTPMLLDLNRYHGVIVSEVQTAVGGKVRLGRISWGITHRIWLEVDGFSIIDATAFPGDVILSRIYASVSIPQLLTRKVVVKDLQLESTEVKFKLVPAAKDTDPPTGGTDYTGVDLPVEIEIQQLAVAIKQLALDDALSLPGQTLRHVFSDVDLTGTDIAPEAIMTFNLSLQDQSPSGLGALKARGTFSGLTKALTLDNADLKLKAALSNLHVEAIKPYLQNDLLSSQLAGKISTEVDYQGDLGQSLHARGTIDLSQLMYSNPSFGDTPLPGQTTTVTFKISLDPQNLTAEKVALKLGTLSVNARGVLHSWNKEPVIKNAEFSSDIRLRDAIPLIPWKQLGDNADAVRAILEEGGRISLTKLTLPAISLAHLPATAAELVPEMKMTAQITGVSIQPTPKIPRIENIGGNVRLENGIAQVQGLTGRIASVALPPVSAKVTNLLEEPKIDVTIDGGLELKAIADEEFKKWLDKIGLEKIVGTADLDLSLALETARPSDFQLKGNVDLKDFQIKTVYTPALLHGLHAKVAISPTDLDLSQASTKVALPAAAAPSADHFSLDVQAHVDDWRSNAFVTLQNFKTSRISLPLLASMVPWGELDQSAKPVKDILDAGGFIAIDVLSFSAMELSKLSEDPKRLLARLKLATTLTDITVPRGLSPAEIKGITGQVNLEKNVLIGENVHSRVGPIALPVLNIRATDIAGLFKIALRAKGPLQVAASGDEQIEQLLLTHGLKSLSISAAVDMSADFDQRRPKQWTANASVVFDDVRATTHPAAVVLDGLKGRVLFSREKTMNITAEKITARVNQAPVRLSGKILHIGSPRMLVSARTFARRLELSHLAELVAALKEMKLEGVLDLDLDAHVPYSAPEKSRLKGTLSTRDAGLQLPSSNLALSKGNVKLRMKGNRATIESMTMEVNDQKVALSGHLSNPVEPKIKMLLTSPDLNLDRLLSLDKAAGASATSSKGKDSPSVEVPTADKTASKAELPPLARKSTADLKVRADRGQYKGLQFEKPQLDLLYKRGVIESYSLSSGIDVGHIATKGSADLRDLDRISFAVAPDISKLQLELIMPALGIKHLPVNGPLTLKGQLRGHTGNSQNILESLDGKLAASLGPGSVSKVGKAGDLIAKLSSAAHLTSLFSGRLFKDLSGQGIPFETISAQSAFNKGTLALSELHFGSDALTIDGHGTIDLINRNLKIETLLVPLAAVDQALDYVPIVGKALEGVTKIQIDLEGPMDAPEIHTAELKQLGEGVESAVEKPNSILEGVGEDLEKAF